MKKAKLLGRWKKDTVLMPLLLQNYVNTHYEYTYKWIFKNDECLP